MAKAYTNEEFRNIVFSKKKWVKKINEDFKGVRKNISITCEHNHTISVSGRDLLRDERLLKCPSCRNNKSLSTCLYCGKEIEKNKKFCSQSCSAKFNNIQKSKNKLNSIDDDTFKQIIESSKLIEIAAERLGFLYLSDYITKLIIERMNYLNVSLSKFKYDRETIKEHIVNAVNISNSLAEAQRNFFPEMDIKTFKKLCKEFNIFKTNPSGKGIRTKSGEKEFERNKEKFVLQLKKETNLTSSSLREKLFKYGFKERKCEKCLNTLWNGLEIPLNVHHKDGDKHNNELDNLEILCPNCHNQTDNYGSKNKIRYKK